MYIRTLDFCIILKDRLRPSDDPQHIKESTQGAMVPPDGEGAHVPIQLRGGLRSPNRTVTPAGTTTIRARTQTFKVRINPGHHVRE